MELPKNNCTEGSSPKIVIEWNSLLAWNFSSVIDSQMSSLIENTFTEMNFTSQ